MAEHPKALEKVRLVIELLRRIPRNRKVTAKELQEQVAELGFERTIRSIQRTLMDLAEAFDIELDEKSKPYGYRWKEHSHGLALPFLSDQESLLLALAEQQVRDLLPASVMKSMDGFFVQARANLSDKPQARQEREWLSKVRVVSTTQPLLPPEIADGVFEEVSAALFGNRWLVVEYKNAAGKTSNADVMPLGLAQQGPRLYLVCRYRGYDNERSLALHRILSAKASTLPFDRPKDFDLKKYDNDGRFGFGEGKLIRLTFRIEKGAGQHLLESRLSEDQEVKDVGDEFEISATVVETEQLEWWLRGFGGQVWEVHKDHVSSEH